MSGTPAFGVTMRMARGVITTAATCTDKTGATTTNIIDVMTGAATGTQVYEIGMKADGDPADGVLLIFIHNGTDYRLYDEFDYANPAAGSTTVAAYTEFRKYDNLFLPSASFKLACANTVATTAGNINVWASGADL